VTTRERVVLRELRPDDAATIFAYRWADDAVFAMLRSEWEARSVSPES